MADPTDQGEDRTITGLAARILTRLTTAIAQHAEDAGYTAEQTTERLRIDRLREDAATLLADGIESDMPNYIRNAHDYRHGFLERLRANYEAGLDGFETFVQTCIEAATFAGRRGTGVIDATGEVLLDLHARACLTAGEVHALLAAGFPFGAISLWRTMYEIEVVAAVIAEHGRSEGGDLTRRWHAAHAVAHYRDAKTFQERAERLGYEPIEDDVMDHLRERADTAVSTYTKTIKAPNGYGWAAKICAPESPTFRRLAEVAGRDHIRGHYGWASHRVHADARGNALNRMRRWDGEVRLAGPTNVGLVDAADLTLMSLWLTTNFVLANVRDGECSAEEIVCMQGLGVFRERIVEAFVVGNDQVHEAERRLRETHTENAE